MKAYINTQFTTDAEGANVPDLGGAETNDDVNYSVYDRTQNGGTGCLVQVTAFPSEMDTIKNASVTTEVTDDDVLADDTVPFGNGNSGLESLDQPDVEVDEEMDKLAVSDVLDADEMNRAYIVHNWTRGPLERSDRRAILSKYGAGDLRELLYVTDAAERETITTNYSLDSLPGNLATSTVARSIIQNQTRGTQVLQDQEVTAMNKAAKALGRNRCEELSEHTREDMDGEMGTIAKGLLDGHCGCHSKMLDYLKGRDGGGPPPWANNSNAPAKGNPAK